MNILSTQPTTLPHPTHCAHYTTTLHTILTTLPPPHTVLTTLPHHTLYPLNYRFISCTNYIPTIHTLFQLHYHPTHSVPTTLPRYTMFTLHCHLTRCVPSPIALYIVYLLHYYPTHCVLITLPLYTLCTVWCVPATLPPHTLCSHYTTTPHSVLKEAAAIAWDKEQYERRVARLVMEIMGIKSRFGLGIGARKGVLKRGSLSTDDQLAKTYYDPRTEYTEFNDLVRTRHD